MFGPWWRAHQIEMIGMGSSARLFGQFREHEKLNELLESVEKTQELLSSLSANLGNLYTSPSNFNDDISDGEEFVGRPLEALRRCIKGHLQICPVIGRRKSLFKGNGAQELAASGRSAYVLANLGAGETEVGPERTSG